MDLVLYTDLMESLLKRLPRWKRDREFFSPGEFFRFAVLSKMSPQVVEEPFVEIILELACREPKPYKHLLLPRETTKSSTLCSLATFLLAEPQYQAWGPRIRIAFDAEVKELSERNTAIVLQALETNHHILREVGNQRPSKDFLAENDIAKSNAPWRISQFKTLHCLKQELIDGSRHAEPSGTTLSMQKSTTGRHYDFRLVDDPITGRTARSEAMKTKALHTHMEAQSQLSAGHSLQTILGTRHADDDIHFSIQQDFSSNFTFQCRTVWDGGPELYKDDFERNADGVWTPKLPLKEINLLWNGYGQLADDVRNCGFPADPEVRKRRALHFLRSRMDDMDSVTWTRNMLNRSIPDEDRIFRPQMFREYRPADFRAQDALTYILLDAASGKDFGSSYRVVAVVSMDRNDIAYVRAIQYGHWTPSDFAKRILDAWRQYTARTIVVEEMAWQEVVQATIKLQAQIMGLPDPRIQVVKGINAASKRARVEAMEPRFVNEKIYFNHDMKDQRDKQGRTIWDETVAQFLKIQDIESQPKLKVDVADTLSLIDGLDEHGTRICRPPRGGPLTRNAALAAAGVHEENGVIRPGQSAAIRLSLDRAKEHQHGKRSLFGGKRGLGT